MTGFVKNGFDPVNPVEYRTVWYNGRQYEVIRYRCGFHKTAHYATHMVGSYVCISGGKTW